MTLTTPSGLNGPVSVLDAPVSGAAAGTYTIEVGAARATVTPPSAATILIAGLQPWRP
jgi:hypothetical protein